MKGQLVRTKVAFFFLPRYNIASTSTKTYLTEQHLIQGYRIHEAENLHLAYSIYLGSTSSG